MSWEVQLFYWTGWFVLWALLVTVLWMLVLKIMRWLYEYTRDMATRFAVWGGTFMKAMLRWDLAEPGDTMEIDGTTYEIVERDNQ